MNAVEALELARKAYPNDEDLRVAYMLGLGDGYELLEERMMNKAVEAEITKDNRSNNVIRVGLLNNGFEIGDKVRVIIVKEDSHE